MLSIFFDFFGELRKKEVFYVNWKGHIFIEDHLNGEGDVDLFVPLIDKAKFEKVASKIGFVNVRSYQADHDFIEHYYAYDEREQKFAHLHVYFKIVTGESFSKNYVLPIDNYLKLNIEDRSGLPTMNGSARRTIFLVRHFLKIGTLYGALQYYREREKYYLEWESFDKSSECKEVREIGITSSDLKRMEKIFIAGGVMKNFLCAKKLKCMLRTYQRRDFFKYHCYLFFNLFVRIFNRLIIKRKKVFHDGLAVAICGLDGTGKSSLVESITSHYSNHFSVKNLHLGRPAATKISLFLKPLLILRSQFKILKGANSSQFQSQISGNNISILYALRSVVLAYDRMVASKKVQKFRNKGYLVVCDRYPGLNEGKMDSPRIVMDKTKGPLYQYLYKVEQKFYRSIKPVDILFNLQAPLEVAIERNDMRDKLGKESTEELRERFSINSGVSFLSDKTIDIDATKSIKNVFATVARDIWLIGLRK